MTYFRCDCGNIQEYTSMPFPDEDMCPLCRSKVKEAVNIYDTRYPDQTDQTDQKE